MQYAHDIGLKVGLYTNGALIDAGKAKAIMEARPAYVRISLNAGDRRVYYEHHNPLVCDPRLDYFSASYGALDRLAMEKARLLSRTTLAISYLLGPDNAADLLNAARLVAAAARRWPGAIGYMRFTPSVNYFGPQQHPRGLFNSALQLLETEVVPLLADAGVESRVYYHRFSGLYEPRPYTACLASGWFGGVGPGGILYWCCEKLFNRDFALGSLLDTPFADLWVSAGRARVAAHVAEAVRGGTSSPCPVVCKPHEHNKVFAKMENLRGRGEIGLARTWLGQIHRIAAAEGADAAARLDGYRA
jgi:hypothetical protein